jgi:hypothetical protein
MIGVTCSHYVWPAITIKLHMMAVANAPGGGRSESLAKGDTDRRG